MTCSINPYDRSDSLVSGFASWWRSWRNRRMAVSDLDRCGADDLERVARDVGVSETELRRVAGKWPGAADLLYRRMEHLKLDAVETAQNKPRVMHDLQRSCMLCQDKRQCERDLSSNPDDPVWREYCPNVITLAALTAEHAGDAAR